MTGPELDQELEAIGRRVSPRVGAAHDAVVSRATERMSGRRPTPAPPWPGRLGGAVLTVAFAGGFAALLAVGVAGRPAAPSPGTPSATGPAVALATEPGAPGATPSPAVFPSLGPLRGVPYPAETAAATPPPAAVVTRAPVVSGGAPVIRVAPSPPTPTAASTAPVPPPSQPPQPTGASTPPAAAGSPHAQPTAPSRVITSPTSGPVASRVVLTERDNGRTIQVHRGDVVEVDLSAPQTGVFWTEPWSTDETVVKRSSGQERSDGSADAIFGAAGAGNAQVQASRMPSCARSTPRCLPPQRIDFLVTIVVTG